MTSLNAITNPPPIAPSGFPNPPTTALAKISDGDRFWHRLGDVGYLDEEGLLWFCGRKAHIVDTSIRRHFSVCCEAIFSEHPCVYRSALIGLGEKSQQTPVLIVEPEPGEFPTSQEDEEKFAKELLQLGQQHEITKDIQRFRFHKSFPVDTRHNVKINREALAEWAKWEVPKEE